VSEQTGGAPLSYDEIMRLREMLRIDRERKDYLAARKQIGRRAARLAYPDGAKATRHLLGDRAAEAVGDLAETIRTIFTMR
jgi:hypothetical protein